MVTGTKKNLNSIIKPFFDINFFFLVITLILFGLVILTSASIELSYEKFGKPFHYTIRQIGYLIFSIFICSFFIFINSYNLKKYSILFFMFFLFLLAIVLMPGIGKDVYGSQRWISYGGYSIQPSEFFKLFYIIWLCAYLDFKDNKLIRINNFIKPIFIFLLGAILLMAEPDFGSTVVLFVMTLSILFIAGAKILHIVSLIIFMSFPAAILVQINPERLSRFNFFEPCNAGDQGYQLCYSLKAIGSGGLLGKGLGASTAKLDYLPFPHTDFIFAILAEELGIFGVIFLIILFYLFIRKCFSIGDKALRVGLKFQGYLSYAIGIFITMQAFLSMFINLGIAPTKGLSLPLFSYGGSNYLVSILSITIIFRIYRDVYKETLNSAIR
tara:strand:- start:207 stop:1358 length:1152 start_codon:yes stop_codon:yes gene_type:complete